MKYLLKFIPASIIRAAGRLQFRLPFLKTIINKIGQSLSGEGVIQRGLGKGLYFNATDCNPGFLAGTSEPLEQHILGKYLKSGDIFYDIGANSGYYVVIAANIVGYSGLVYAFEPTPSLVLRIKENIEKNSFKNVSIVESAVSNIDGKVNFNIISEMNISNSIYFGSSENSMSVLSLRLDTFVQENRPPSVLLIDVEGAEQDVLEGGLKMIAQYKPVIMVEVHWLGADFVEFLERSILPLGYKMSTYDGKTVPRETVRYHALLLPETS